MGDWRDFNDDGKVDFWETELAEELTSVNYDDDDEDEDNDLIFDLELRGYDSDDIEYMDEDELKELLEEEGLDPSDYDLY